ncbi:MAG TPA: alpha-L-fucosidase, partial [Lacipirellulaceae bacterium]|nr:alpha-L-fucosidase [Lacipirellulaceae bacterium]
MSTKPLWSWCLLFTAVGAALVAGSARSQTPLPAESPEQRDARMAWWREARFGMFIHWGLYAVPAGRWNEAPVPGIGEWIQQRANIPREQYEQLATRFDPVKYDPGAWARLAAEAGVRYVIITAKHHDGFCLWETNATDWNVVDRTPYRRDLLGPLAEACRGEGIRFCVYYSIMDWHHPAQDKTGDDYNPSTMKPGRKQQYIDDMQVQ